MHSKVKLVSSGSHLQTGSTSWPFFVWRCAKALAVGLTREREKEASPAESYLLKDPVNGVDHIILPVKFVPGLFHSTVLGEVTIWLRS